MKYILLYLLFIILIISCSSPKPKVEVEESITIDSTAYYDSLLAKKRFKVDSFFTSLNKKTIFYGNVLFAENGYIILEKSFGYANRKTKELLTPNHTFQLASSSKPFTAIAIFLLIERGKIQLTDTVNKYIPNFPYEGITIHHLLSHQSGMAKYTHFIDNPSSIWPNRDSTIYNNQAIEIMNRIKPPISFKAGKKFKYCNTNYLLLAQIVENVTGIKFWNFLNDAIFIPCGMENTVVYHRDNFDDLKLPAIGYDGRFRPLGDIYLNGCVGDKGVYSSTRDLLKFDLALHSGKIISKKSLEIMTTVYSTNKVTNKKYGYGFRLTDDAIFGKTAYHNGWWWGFRTNYIHKISKNQTIIVMSNVKRGTFLQNNDLLQLIN